LQENSLFPYVIRSELEFASEDDKISARNMINVRSDTGSTVCDRVDSLLQVDRASSAFYGMECASFSEDTLGTAAATSNDDSAGFQGVYLFLAGAGSVIITLCIIAVVCSSMDESSSLDRELSNVDIEFRSSEMLEDPNPEKRSIVKAANIRVETGGEVMPKERFVGGASTLTIEETGSRIPYSISNAVMQEPGGALTVNQSEEFRDYDDLEMTPMQKGTTPMTAGEGQWVSLVHESDNEDRDKEAFESEFAAMCGIIDEDDDEVIQVEEFERILSCATDFFPGFSLDTTNGKVSKEDLKELFKKSDSSGYDLDKLKQFKIELESYSEDSSDADLSSVKPSPEFEAEFKELCDLVDVDGDKTISLEEFARVYPVATQTFYKMLDTNGDASLSIEEFREMFILADGSGDLDQVREMMATLKSDDQKFEVEFKELVDLIDADGDKRISLGEFAFARAFPVASQTFFKKLDIIGGASLSIEEFRDIFILADGSGDLDQIRKMRATLEFDRQKVDIDEPGGESFDDPDNVADIPEQIIE